MSHQPSEFLSLFAGQCCTRLVGTLEAESFIAFYERAAGFALPLGRGEPIPDTIAYLTYDDLEETTWTDGFYSVANHAEYDVPWSRGADPVAVYDAPVIVGSVPGARPFDRQTTLVENFRDSYEKTISYHHIPSTGSPGDPDPEQQTAYSLSKSLSAPYSAQQFLLDVHGDANELSLEWFASHEGDGLDIARSIVSPSGAASNQKRGRLRVVFPAWSTFLAARALATEFCGDMSDGLDSGGGLAEPGTPRQIDLPRYAAGLSPELVPDSELWAGPWQGVNLSRAGAQVFLHGIQFQRRGGYWKPLPPSGPFILLQTRSWTLPYTWTAIQQDDANPDLWYKKLTASNALSFYETTAGPYTSHEHGEEPAGDDSGGPMEYVPSIEYTLEELIEDARFALQNRAYGPIKMLGNATYGFYSGELATLRPGVVLSDSVYRIGLPPQKPGAVPMKYRWIVETFKEPSYESTAAIVMWTATPQTDQAVFSDAFAVPAPAEYGYVIIRQFEQSGDGGTTWQPLI